jgi:hypothetical protein
LVLGAAGLPRGGAGSPGGDGRASPANAGRAGWAGGLGRTGLGRAGLGAPAPPRGLAADLVGGAVLARTRERCGSRGFAPGLSLIVGRCAIGHRLEHSVRAAALPLHRMRRALPVPTRRRGGGAEASLGCVAIACSDGRAR